MPALSKTVLLLSVILVTGTALAAQKPTREQLARWLERFPEADANRDGRLTADEAAAYRQRRQKSRSIRGKSGRGVPREFAVDPRWQDGTFPDDAVCYRSPREIAAVYSNVLGGKRDPVTSYPKPQDGSLRIVGTGHSFMGPGYKTFPVIARAAGFDQPPLLTHTGGGMTGSARYKWEQENGVFQFAGKPVPKLLASIANARWDAMMWGPYFNDQPAYYTCWIDFCLKYNPHMKFYLSDAWPQLDQLDTIPTSEDTLTPETFVRLGKEKHALYAELIKTLNNKYGERVFVLPTCDAMVLAVQYYARGELPGVEGIHALVGKKERSLWRDRLGHLGPGFERLEGYVFYATIYGRSPELIHNPIPFPGRSQYPSRELDLAFRKIAWEAVIGNPLSGVTDEDGNGIADQRK
jgi:hypothetical protein